LALQSARDNISRADAQDLADYGALLLSLETAAIRNMIADGELMEVFNDGET
jgi:hypothetical protein